MMNSMPTALMDPNLELQQLASEALNYSATPPQHQTQPVPTSSSATGAPNSLTPESDSNPEHRFVCPFSTCNRLYKRKDLLKRHLTTLLASPDEHHQDQTTWEEVRAEGTMTIYTRPRNLTDEQKKQRRKESNLRHRVKYADELKEKRNRKRRVEKLLEGKQVGVQTPDWDAEARATQAAAAEVQAQQEIPPAEQHLASEAHARTSRRVGRTRP